ncbi:hypothetical protein MASR2M78_04150 [Treponema sp.]
MDKGLKDDGLLYGMALRDFSSYLTWSPDDERWQLVCVDVGASEVKPGSPYPSEKASHPADHRSVATGRTVAEYQLVYITKGRGELRIEGIEDPIPIQEGSVILVLPGVRHAYKPDENTGWNEKWVGFKGNWADSLRREGLLSAKHPVFSIGLQEGVLGLFDELFAVLSSQEPLYQVLASSLVMRLIAELLAGSRSAEQEDDAEKACD